MAKRTRPEPSLVLLYEQLGTNIGDIIDHSQLPQEMYKLFTEFLGKVETALDDNLSIRHHTAMQARLTLPYILTAITARKI